MRFSYSSVHLQFSFESCRFHVRKDKEGTARVVAWNFGVKYSYTLEASLGGTTMDGKVRFRLVLLVITTTSFMFTRTVLLDHRSVIISIRLITKRWVSTSATLCCSSPTRIPPRYLGTFPTWPAVTYILINLVHFHYCQERMRARIQARLVEMGSCAEWPASVPIDDLER